MTTAIEFLEGAETTDGLTVDKILAFDDETMERKHDWVQWAFPIDEPSAYNADAPVVTAMEMRALSKKQSDNLKKLLMHYIQFLYRTDHWRQPNNHNHLRITRLMRCLRLVGFHVSALSVFHFAFNQGNPSDVTKRFWRAAITKV